MAVSGLTALRTLNLSHFTRMEALRFLATMVVDVRMNAWDGTNYTVLNPSALRLYNGTVFNLTIFARVITTLATDNPGSTFDSSAFSVVDPQYNTILDLPHASLGDGVRFLTSFLLRRALALFDVPGLEYTLPKGRLHFAPPAGQLHYSLADEDR